MSDPRDLKIVPSRRDPGRCAALVRSVEGHPQCGDIPTTMRDGYPVCRRHARARFFEPWTGVTMLEASRAYGRVIERLRHPPDPLKVIKGDG